MIVVAKILFIANYLKKRINKPLETIDKTIATKRNSAINLDKFFFLFFVFVFI